MKKKNKSKEYQINYANDTYDTFDGDAFYDEDLYDDFEEEEMPTDKKTVEYADTKYRVVLDPGKYSYNKRPTLAVSKWQKRMIRLMCVVATGILIYSFLVYTQIPFIAKWRTLYIETAMGTMTHQWLATSFIPKSVIEKAMWEYDKLIASQDNLESNWDDTQEPFDVPEPDEPEVRVDPDSPWLEKSHAIYKQFPELDVESFAEYMQLHGETAVSESGKIMIDESDREQEGTSIKTTHGDMVLAVDEANGILIVEITGEGYMGRVAIVSEPSRVGMGIAKNFGTSGSQMKYIASHNNAILAINANGFEDPDGRGNGGIPYGYIVSNGVEKNPSVLNHYKVIGFDNNDRMYIGKYKEGLSLRDAGEFTPALIINGEKVVEGSAGWGIQPRSAIGQRKNGDVLMLVIDGRQTHSVGATVEDAADQLLKYGAVQACNLDGGSSAVMYYNGRVISQPSAADKIDGRLLPCGFIVKALPQE